MPCAKLYLLPIAVFVWFVISFLVTYIIALNNDHIYPLFPYISDNGVFAPESCIFAQLFSIGCRLVGVVIYIRYVLIKNIAENYILNTRIKQINTTTLWLGLLSALGISIVGNFQEKTIWNMHMTGAAMIFVGATVYQFLQILLSFLTYSKMGSKIIIGTRLGITTVYCISLIKCVVFGAISLQQFNATYSTKWSPGDNGYTFHVISSINEWTMTILLFCFLLTYTYEFKSMIIYEPAIEIR